MENANLKKTKSTNSLWICTVILLTASIFSSCSKSETDNNPTGNTTKLIINIDGINDPKSEIKTKASINATSANIEISKLRKSESIRSNDIIIDVISEQNNIDTNIGQSVQANNVSIGSISNKASIKPKAAQVPMSSGIKYCFLLFDKATNVLRHAVIATSGQPLAVEVSKDSDFKWVAYSFNSTDTFELPNTNNPVITTPVDKPLLYASGNITPAMGNNNVPITFNHKLTQFNIALDSRAMFLNVSEISARFEEGFIKSSAFNLLTGQKTGTLTNVEVGDLKFTNVVEGSNRLKEAKAYYTADESLSYYDVKFTSIAGEYPNGSTEKLTDKLPNNGVVRFNTFTTPNIGNVLVGRLKLWLLLPTKTIYHYGTESNRGYEANEGTASGNFIRSAYNFGPQSNYLRIRGFNNVQVPRGNGNMAKALSSPSNYPDIIICGMFNNLNAADYAALGLYLQRGGVLFLMTESTSTALRTWFRNTLSSAALTTPRQDGSGAVYKINNVDPDVLNGVFGDVRGKYWGQDRSSTQYMENINPNDIIAYTGGSVNFTSRSGVTMFRHKTLNLFFVGDTGFLANRLNDGSEERDTAYPFATVGGSGPDMHFPTSTPYGRRSATGSLESGRAAGSWQVENGVIFGNVFTWLLERSHFAGVNRTP